MEIYEVTSGIIAISQIDGALNLVKQKKFSFPFRSLVKLLPITGPIVFFFKIDIRFNGIT